MEIHVKINTPTPTFKEHVINALYNGSSLSQITSVCFLDENEDEADCADAQLSVSDRLYVFANITGTYLYTTSKIIIKAGVHRYFEANKILQVAEGKTYSITAQVNISLSGTYQGRNVYNRNLSRFIYDVLMGEKSSSQLNISTVTFSIVNLDVNEIYDVDITPVKSMFNTSLELMAEYDAMYNWALNSITVKCPAGELYLYITNLSNEPRRIIFIDRIQI